MMEETERNNEVAMEEEIREDDSKLSEQEEEEVADVDSTKEYEAISLETKEGGEGVTKENGDKDIEGEEKKADSNGEDVVSQIELKQEEEGKGGGVGKVDGAGQAEKLPRDKYGGSGVIPMDITKMTYDEYQERHHHFMIER